MARLNIPKNNDEVKTMYQFYVVDDLRHETPKIARFFCLNDAVRAYKAIPTDNRKALGVNEGNEAVDLVQCLPTFPNDWQGEDVMVLKFLDIPLWKSNPHIVETAQELAVQLHIRYCLFKNCLIPAPERKTLPKKLDGRYLWPDNTAGLDSAIRWVYVAGVGRLSPAEFVRRRDHGGAFSYPLVLRIKACGVDLRGNYKALEVKPWDYHLLARRTKERLDQNKIRQGGSSK